MLRYMRKHGLKWFPTLLQQSQFNQRARQVWPALVLLQQALGHMLASDARGCGMCRTVVCRKPKATAAIGLAERKAVEAIMVAGITASEAVAVRNGKGRHYRLVGRHCQHGRSLDAGSLCE